MCIQSVRTLFVCGRRRRRWMRTKWIYSYFGGCHSHDTSARMTPFICTPPIVGVAALAWIGAAEIYCADSDGKLNVTHAQSKDWASRRAIKYTHFNRNLITMSMLTIKFVENVSFIAQTQNVCELIMLMREIKKKRGKNPKRIYSQHLFGCLYAYLDTVLAFYSALCCMELIEVWPLSELKENIQRIAFCVFSLPSMPCELRAKCKICDAVDFHF